MNIQISFTPTIRRAVHKMVDAVSSCLEANLTQETCIRKGRKALRDAGFEPSPVGVGNSKTELPGTYRKVGKTCHVGCSLLGNGCYAQKGHVNIAQNRATGGIENDLAAVTLAVLTAWFHSPEKLVPARLHVSGDILKEGNQIDEEYVAGLVAVGRAVRALGVSSPVVAFLYSHAPQELLQALRVKERLAEVGIFLRRSLDEAEGDLEGTALVVDTFEEVASLREQFPNIKFIKCLEQLADIPCAKCKVCFQEKTERACVLFRVH